jgi:GntR family transcriptional regulator, transcriptional repressor for pyruvate dehydrogenase complex
LDNDKLVKLSEAVLNRGRISDQIKEVIKRAMLNGEFKAGDKLPREDQLASLLKVSKVTVREALRDLEGEGMIQKRRGPAGGNFIAHPNMSRMKELISNCFQFGTVAPHELVEAGLMLEQTLLPLAAQRRTQDDLARIAINIKEREEGLASGVLDLKKMIAFHHILADSCRDRILSAVLHALITVSVRNLPPVSITKEDFKAHLKDSKDLYECMLRQDSAAAQTSIVSIFKRYLDFHTKSKRPKQRAKGSKRGKGNGAINNTGKHSAKGQA